jgi:hypothetical protein
VVSLGKYVPGVVACLNGSVCRCVSAADSSLSLSLSLFGPASAAGLTAKRRQAVIPLAGDGKPRLNAHCSKLPSHARNDVRRPREVTRDRNSAYTHANVRQAHCERTCRAPGGVAGPPRTSLSHCQWTSHAPGGMAVFPHTRGYPCASSSRSSFQSSACAALGAGTLDSQEER